ncbi:LysR family transcriptional regulator [Piscinibacter sakaiensis]|uniref:LysR family transcriptional regulator n=1 Tax=Piscinibacter sakaiensis TaxID=1547922 RepID=UPI003AAFCD7C
MHGLQQLLAFAQTARRGSFAAAARDLGGSPSALAKSVARLEDSLGVKLFHRTTRQVSLTADGERLFHRCERVLAEFDDLQSDASGTRSAPSGTLRIDVPIVYGRRFVMPLLAELHRRHPALQFEVRMDDGFADLVRDGIDLAVRIGELGDSSLVARRIDQQKLIMVASPAYLQAHGQPQRIEDLAAHTAVVFRLHGSGRSRPWQLRQGRRVVELHPPFVIQLNDSEGLADAARLGFGLCQLPDYVVSDELARGELLEVLPAHQPPPMPVSAVMPSGRLLPPRVRVLLDSLAALRDRGG